MRGAFWWVRHTAKLNRNQNQKGLSEERIFCHKMETHRPCWIWGFGWSPEFAPSLLLPVTTPSQSYPRARAKHLISPASSVEKWSCPDDSGRKVMPQTLMVQLVPWTNYHGEAGWTCKDVWNLGLDVGAERQTAYLRLTKPGGSTEILGFLWWGWVVNILQQAWQHTFILRAQRPSAPSELSAVNFTLMRVGSLHQEILRIHWYWQVCWIFYWAIHIHCSFCPTASLKASQGTKVSIICFLCFSYQADGGK